MEFRTKREAEEAMREAIPVQTNSAVYVPRTCPHIRPGLVGMCGECHPDLARIRALLPTLPD